MRTSLGLAGRLISRPLGSILSGEAPLQLKKPSIVFVCAGNTCRSLMPEWLTKAHAASELHVASAGMRPQPPEDGSNAIEALAVAYSIDASSHVPRDVRDIELDSFAVIVAMDRRIARELKGLSASKPVVWEIADPWGNDPTEYRRTAIIISQKVNKLLRSLGIEVRDAA